MKETFYTISLWALCLIAGIFLIISSSLNAEGEEIKKATKSDLMRGKRIYSVSCILCHGSKGEGDGPASVFIGPYSHPRPNDYTRGSFKFRTTESGDLPTLSDLMSTIRYGIPGFMPSFRHLGEEGLRQVALYVATEFIREELPAQTTYKEPVEKTVPVQKDDIFEEDIFQEDMSRTSKTERAPSVTDKDIIYKDIVKQLDEIRKDAVIAARRINVLELIRKDPRRSDPSAQEAVSRGKKTFAEMQCIQCHGADGRGHMAKTNMKDERGLHTMAADLTKPETFGNGNTPEDIYRTIMTGLNGTPMPSFSDLFRGNEERVWDIVAYIRSLWDE